MQVTRLFKIIYILLNKKTVTAKTLAEEFEVSVRTIYRDIEVLSEAGIPIYATKGKGGGLHLMEDFILNKSLLSPQEQTGILSALEGLKATHIPEADEVLSKLTTFFGKTEAPWIDVDFSDWNPRTTLQFKLIKEAITQHQVIEFFYYNTNSEKLLRKVEPFQLYFKGKTWYLRAFCLTRNDYRLFKLSRIKSIKLCDTYFTQREISELSNETPASPVNLLSLKLWISRFAAYRVYDDFEEHEITETASGNYIVSTHFSDGEWLYGYLLSYGPLLKVLEPSSLAHLLIEKLESTRQLYLEAPN